MAKAMTLRLDEIQAGILDTIGQINGTSVAEEIRIALRERIATLGRDPEFQARLHEHLNRNEEILDGLRGESEVTR